MKGWLIVVLAAAVLTACEPAPPGEQAAVGDSPIASFDKTRLWIFVRAVVCCCKQRPVRQTTASQYGCGQPRMGNRRGVVQ